MVEGGLFKDQCGLITSSINDGYSSNRYFMFVLLCTHEYINPDLIPLFPILFFGGKLKNLVFYDVMLTLNCNWTKTSVTIIKWLWGFCTFSFWEVNVFICIKIVCNLSSNWYCYCCCNKIIVIYFYYM